MRRTGAPHRTESTRPSWPMPWPMPPTQRRARVVPLRCVTSRPRHPHRRTQRHAQRLRALLGTRRRPPRRAAASRRTRRLLPGGAGGESAGRLAPPPRWRTAAARAPASDRSSLGASAPLHRNTQRPRRASRHRTIRGSAHGRGIPSARRRRAPRIIPRRIDRISASEVEALGVAFEPEHSFQRPLDGDRLHPHRAMLDRTALERA
jgi:hypothetical protein